MMQLKRNLETQEKREEKFSSLDITYEEEHALAWYRMNAYPRPCLTRELIDEAQVWFDQITKEVPCDYKLKYMVMASKVPGVFNLGGDLSLFIQLIREKDKETLLKYDIACIEAMHRIHRGLEKEITSIALVQGDALGGGFEGVLANEIIIAEKSSKMGLPDILFNLFPGAGAYSFLYRKVGAALAEEMVLSGKLYTAQELYDLGVVNILVEDGKGEQAVYNYIKKENRQRNGRLGFRKVKNRNNPVTLDELIDGAKIWAETAMNLEEKDLRMMERLVKRQSALLNH